MTNTSTIGTSMVLAGGDEFGDVPMVGGDGLEELAILDTLTNEDIATSLDGWLGQFALTPHPPTSPSPHAMALGWSQTHHRTTLITDQDERMSAEEANRAT